MFRKLVRIHVMSEKGCLKVGAENCSLVVGTIRMRGLEEYLKIPKMKSR